MSIDCIWITFNEIDLKVDNWKKLYQIMCVF